MLEPNSEQIALAKKLCHHLPDYEPDIDRCRGVWCTVKHKSGDGRSLAISQEGPKNRKYIVHCDWPHDQGRMYRPDDDSDAITQIGVSAKRGPEALAKEIARRLLPSYDKHYAAQQERQRVHTEHENAEFQLRDYIVKELLGDTIPAHLEKSSQLPCYRHGLRKVAVSGGDSVQLETSYLPKDVAIKVVQLLKREVSGTY